MLKRFGQTIQSLAGHSKIIIKYLFLLDKWSKIKHQKAVNDPRHAVIAGKVSREISSCVREGGKDIDVNFKLRFAIEKAKKLNIPKKVIENAIASGEGKNAKNFISYQYSGYGINGIGVILFCVTDNVNRLLQEVRKIFNDHQGGQGDAYWAFEKVGLLTFSEVENEKEQEMLIEDAIQFGASDFEVVDKEVNIYCDVQNLHEIETNMKEKYNIEHCEIIMKPKDLMELTNEEDVEVFDKMMEKLDANADVNEIFHNLKQ
eukprot:gene2169-2034_t